MPTLPNGDWVPIDHPLWIAFQQNHPDLGDGRWTPPGPGESAALIGGSHGPDLGGGSAWDAGRWQPPGAGESAALGRRPTEPPPFQTPQPIQSDGGSAAFPGMPGAWDAGRWQPPAAGGSQPFKRAPSQQMLGQLAGGAGGSSGGSGFIARPTNVRPTTMTVPGQRNLPASSKALSKMAKGGRMY